MIRLTEAIESSTRPRFDVNITKEYNTLTKFYFKFMEDINQKIDDILEIVNFLKDNSVTKTEFYEFKEEMTEFKEEMIGFKEETRNEFQKVRDEMSNEFKKVRNEIINHVDAFVGLHQNLEIELSAVAHKTDRLENNVHQIAKHLELQLN